jgi:hypothetical protein
MASALGDRERNPTYVDLSPPRDPSRLQDPRDGWEPGVPSLRALAPSIIGGAVVPIGVYYLVRIYVSSDTPALAIAGVPAALWVAGQWMRTRRLDPIGAFTLFGFVGGLAASYALGGSAFVLKIREAVLSWLLGAGCLASIRLLPKPVKFYVGRALSAGNDPVREELFDQVWDLPSASRLFTIITAVWGCGLLLDAVVRIFLATIMPTGPFLAAAPAVDGAFIAAMFTSTIVLNKRLRVQMEQSNGEGEVKP